MKTDFDSTGQGSSHQTKSACKPGMLPDWAAVQPVPSWFNSEERIARLCNEAKSWVGTPFFANGNTKGKGVSCQKLVSEIYRAVGCCDVVVPNVAMAHARFSRSESLVEKFMDTCQCFARVDLPIAGDLLGFRLGKVVHHLGICLGNSFFVHAMEHTGTGLGTISDPTWGTRLASVWRPKL